MKTPTFLTNISLSLVICLGDVSFVRLSHYSTFAITQWP